MRIIAGDLCDALRFVKKISNGIFLLLIEEEHRQKYKRTAWNTNKATWFCDEGLMTLPREPYEGVIRL